MLISFDNTATALQVACSFLFKSLARKKGENKTFDHHEVKVSHIQQWIQDKNTIRLLTKSHS